MVDLTPEDFDELVARALDTLPAELAALMSNVAVFVGAEAGEPATAWPV